MEFSVLIGVGFYGCPNTSNLVLIGIAIWELWKTLLTSASAADATTCHSVLHSTNITPFLKNFHLCVVCFLDDKNLQFYYMLLEGKYMLHLYIYEVAYH